MIHPTVMMALTRHRVEDLRRSSAHPLQNRATLQPQRVDASDSTVTLRLAVANQDDEVITGLAALDDSSIPESPILLAFVDGEALAGLSLTDGTVIADPFHRTVYLVGLLHARARQLDHPRQPRRSRRPRSFSLLRAQLTEHR